ncbi:XisI protein [Brasilonema sp. CT11]|nr:XisI protein [Brasilonema sp. CT11]
MDKVSLYRQYIQELLSERAKLRSPNDPIESETIFDTTSDCAKRRCQRRIAISL